jgi:hypothetical protein
MFSTAVYPPLQCSVLQYIFHCIVQYFCIYLPFQCSVLLYIFHFIVQYFCIYLQLQCSVLLYIFHCSVQNWCIIISKHLAYVSLYCASPSLHGELLTTVIKWPLLRGGDLKCT